MIFFSCNSNETRNNNEAAEINNDYYLNMRDHISDNLNDIGDDLRNNNCQFGDRSMIRAIISQDSYKPENLIHFDKTVSTLQTKTKSGNYFTLKDCLDPYMQRITNDIDWNISHARTPQEFEEMMVELKDEIVSSYAPENRQKEALALVATMSSSVNFINKNLDLFEINHSLKSGGWWKRWGRCAASIIGGAGTVALGAGLAGAGAGTIALPVIGTVAVGTAAAITGAVVGAIGGAAAGCGGSNGNTVVVINVKFPAPVKYKELVKCQDKKSNKIF